METVKNTLINIYSEILDSYRDDSELKFLRTSVTFYEFVEEMFCRFKNKCKNIDSEDLILLMNGNFRGKCTKRRFLNALDRIIEKFRIILQKTYEGDLKSAIKHTEELMNSKKHISHYLNDLYINYLTGTANKDIAFYRMRDVKKEDKNPNNCWHIPFVDRQHAAVQRYNTNGYPCLYLADSKGTANKELGTIAMDKNRWCSEFKTKKSIFLFDLTIPTSEDIQEEQNKFFLLGWLLTYPLRMLCSIKVYNKGNFPEEYIFPQLFFQWIYLMKGYNFRDGFVYSSTQRIGGKNYVFPAKYKTKTPPKHSDIQIDKKLQQLFEASVPELYTEDIQPK